MDKDIAIAKEFFDTGNKNDALDCLSKSKSEQLLQYIIQIDEFDLMKRFIDHYIDEDFIVLVAKSYDELLLKNCKISYRMKKLIEQFLISKRTLIQKTTTVSYVTTDKISKTCELISDLRTYDVDAEKFATTIKDILLNIEIIRNRYLRNLEHYQKLKFAKGSKTSKLKIFKMPFDQMEYYLMCILNYVQKTNQIFQNEMKSFLDFKRLFENLDTFKDELLNLKDYKLHQNDFKEFLEDYDKLVNIYSADRIKWTIDLITNIGCKEDTTNIIKLKFISKNIFVLERQFKSNEAIVNGMCFTQLLFYIGLYINSIENGYNFLPMTLCILDYNKLVQYLNNFKDNLQNIRDPDPLKNIQLVSDYKALRIYFLLEKMLSYLKSVSLINPDDIEDFWILNIERTLQVIGECICEINNVQINYFIKLSTSTEFFTKIIKKLRQKLTKYPALMKRFDAGLDIKYFQKIQEELNFITEFIEGLLLLEINEILVNINKSNENNGFLKLPAFQEFITERFKIFQTNSNLVKIKVKKLIDDLLCIKYISMADNEQKLLTKLKKFKFEKLDVIKEINRFSRTNECLDHLCAILRIMELDFSEQVSRLQTYEHLVSILNKTAIQLPSNSNIRTSIVELHEFIIYNSITKYKEIFETKTNLKEMEAKELFDKISDELNSNTIKNELDLQKKQISINNKSNYENMVEIFCELNELDLKDKYEMISNFLKNCSDLDSIDRILGTMFETDKMIFLNKLEDRKNLVLNFDANGNTDGIIKNAFELIILECKEVLKYLSLLPEDIYFLDEYCPMLIGRNARNYIAHGSVLFDLIFKEKFIAFHIICEHFYHIDNIFELQPYSTTKYNLERLKNRFNYAVLDSTNQNLNVH